MYLNETLITYLMLSYFSVMLIWQVLIVKISIFGDEFSDSDEEGVNVYK